MNKKAFALASIAIIIWASSFAGIRASLLGGYTPAHLVLVRFLVASGVFILYSLLPNVHFQIPKTNDLGQIFLLGFLGITVYHTGLTFGVETIPAGTASMIVGAAPIFTALIAVLFMEERLEWFSWIGLVIGFIGIILITIGSSGASFSFNVGALFVLIGAISTAAFFVLQKPLFAHYKPIELTAYFTWAGTLPLLIFLPGLWNNVQQATVEANLSAIFVGIFPAAIAYTAWTIALSLGNATKISMMLYIEPAVAIIIAWVWLNEWPENLSLIGGLIAISSVLVVNILGRKSRTKEKKS